MGGIVIKKLYAYITGKSVKQRICICIVLTAVLTLLIFTVKANFFDEPNVPQTPNTSTSESADNGAESEAKDYKPPSFHISLIDSGVLLAVIAAYSVHKIREKRKQRRL